MALHPLLARPSDIHTRTEFYPPNCFNRELNAFPVPMLVVVEFDVYKEKRNPFTAISKSAIGSYIGMLHSTDPKRDGVGVLEVELLQNEAPYQILGSACTSMLVQPEEIDAFIEAEAWTVFDWSQKGQG